MKPEEVDWHEFGQFWVWVGKLCLVYRGSVRSGPRSFSHNLSVGGSTSSKHTFPYGWGMAADIWFDHPDDRRAAIQSTLFAHPEYHCYTGPPEEPYPARQLHIQGWKFGETPKTRAPVIP